MVRMFLLIFCLASLTVNAKQRVDLHYKVKNTYRLSSAKLVMIDEAHHNFHTLDGRYQPFANVLTSAGFTVKKNTHTFTSNSLKHVDVLVIANALHEKNTQQHDLPNYGAFSQSEIEAVHQWVKQGGSLFLIADHMPWPAASAALAASFGFQFNNSYVEVLGSSEQFFSVKDNSLVEHSILNGLANSPKVTKIRGFMGQAFLSPPQAKPLMVFTQDAVAYMPAKAWQISDDTPTISALGWHQGATLNFHQGRVAVFGEAGMFTAQVDNDDHETWKMGMNAVGAEQNEQFLLNTMLWLVKLL